jgi:hypothetical protein
MDRHYLSPQVNVSGVPPVLEHSRDDRGTSGAVAPPPCKHFIQNRSREASGCIGGGDWTKCPGGPGANRVLRKSNCPANLSCEIVLIFLPDK